MAESSALCFHSIVSAVQSVVHSVVQHIYQTHIFPNVSYGQIE